MTGKNTIPHKVRKSGKKHARKMQRWAEAIARQTAFDVKARELKWTPIVRYEQNI